MSVPSSAVAVSAFSTAARLSSVTPVTPRRASCSSVRSRLPAAVATTSTAASASACSSWTVSTDERGSASMALPSRVTCAGVARPVMPSTWYCDRVGAASPSACPSAAASTAA